MKIGIMGGTFDPIHNGHLMLGEMAYKQFDLDIVWFMPNGRPPHKAFTSIESDVAKRVEMVTLAIEDCPYFTLQDYELNRQEVSCSYETMEHFNKVYPDVTFYFIIGADSLRNIEKWVHPERLLKTCHVLAACRDDWNTDQAMLDRIAYLNKKYDAEIELLRAPLIDISSSELREKIKAGESIHGLVPVKVERYIAKEGLYEPENSQNKKETENGA